MTGASASGKPKAFQGKRAPFEISPLKGIQEQGTEPVVDHVNINSAALVGKGKERHMPRHPEA